ncbi:MAG: sulfur carrier protein ThiS [Acidobacteriota bacterium]
MKILLNNRNETYDEWEKISVEQLLKLKNFTFPMIIVKINGKLIKKENYSDSVIKDGDDVTALHLISGG